MTSITKASYTKRGRKPKRPLSEQTSEAFLHIHDLDWLQECDLADLPEVREKANPHSTMPEGLALRGLLAKAVLQVIIDIKHIPGMTGVTAFLEGYLRGTKVTEIARQLNVSREWCYRSYRKEALSLVNIQFIRTLTVDR